MSSISAGTGSSWSRSRPIGMWCDTALRTVWKIVTSLWQAVGRDRLLKACRLEPHPYGHFLHPTQTRNAALRIATGCIHQLYDKTKYYHSKNTPNYMFH